jgi:hypothetical protein
MAVRSAASIAGFVGGILLLLGGVVTFLTGLGPQGERLIGAAGAAVVAVVLGLLVVMVSRPRFWWWTARATVNGVLLLVLGVVAWVLVGDGLLAEVGAFLAVLAGVLMLVSVAVGGPFGWRRRTARRYF